MAANAKQKAALRRALLARRSALSPSELQLAGRAVVARIRQAAWFHAVSRVALYAAICGEVPVQDLLADESKRLWAFPRVEFGTRRLSFWRLSPGTSLVPSTRGIPEPPARPGFEMPLEVIELILVPGVAFDPNGTRLGQGGGYYDVTLGATPALRVGVAHPFQIIDDLPREAHDLPVDLIVTPAGVLHPPRKAAN